MNCCQCQAIEKEFNPKTASKQLKTYRRQGPARTTRMLIEALKAEGVEGLTLLDIGGGVGAVQHALLQAGVSRAINADASAAYLEAARQEAERQGHAERISFRHGDFVELAGDIPPADVVTLDRVICCYPDMPALVGLSSARARRLYGLVYPRDTWWIRMAFAVGNLALRLWRNPFRVFSHPSQAVDALLNSGGLQRRFYGRTLLWQVVVYARQKPGD